MGTDPLTVESPSGAIAWTSGLVGATLSAYQHAHALDDVALANALGIAPESLLHLKRCPFPWPDPYHIRLSRLAEAFGVDAHVFAVIMQNRDQSPRSSTLAGG